ncbi:MULTISPECIES: TIR domain-containing protein [Leuconostoc]|uniref:TIR domain-containing protein n=1 Tax=Leuconostoc TaxID=1243 RepID=UPI001239E6C3|nr:TIR domain-containing protein [Leuconostoc carnosum]KAA8365042.1 molecular chaperone Tir [Leuconostoc carnosum]
MSTHKCFISFKFKDEWYKKQIQENLQIDMIDKSLDEPIDSNNPDYIMQTIRDNNLKDSSVTIFLIGIHSSENDNENDQYFIKKELQASLYRSYNHGRNGILGIVLPNMYNTIYSGEGTCQKCGSIHRYVNVNDSTAIKEFSANYYIEKGHSSCSWTDDQRYCILVKWDDFILNPNKYIDESWEKRQSEIVKKVTVYPK